MGVLVNISGSSSMTMEEFEEASTIIHEKVHEDANIIVGLVIDESLGEKIKITAIATGFGEQFETKDKITESAEVQRAPYVPPVAGTMRGIDVPTHIRNRGNELSGRRRELPSLNRDLFGDDDQFDIPTFLRRRVD